MSVWWLLLRRWWRLAVLTRSRLAIGRLSIRLLRLAVLLSISRLLLLLLSILRLRRRLTAWSLLRLAIRRLLAWRCNMTCQT